MFSAHKTTPEGPEGAVTVAAQPPVRLRRVVRELPGAPDPWSLSYMAAPGARRVVWHDPGADLSWVAVGQAHRWTVPSAPSTAAACSALRGALAAVELSDEAPEHLDEATLRALPLAVGGLCFDPQAPGWPGWPAAELVVPQVLIVRRAGQTWWVTVGSPPLSASRTSVENAPLSGVRPALADARFPRPTPGALGPDWGRGVCTARFTHPLPQTGGGAEREARGGGGGGGGSLIARAEALAADPATGITKIVVARGRDVVAPGGGVFDVPATLRRLRERHGDCVVFGVERSGEGCFLGATPETLVRVDGRGCLETMSLAGTVARTGHDDAGERSRMLDSAHLRREQRVVTDEIVAALAPLCEDLEAEATPSVRTLRTLHHLQTGIRGRLRAGAHVLEAVAALHPTPAVGGLPRQAALDWLRAHEGLDRGAYAAPVGWVDAGGGGHFAVALRCARLSADRRTARVFAGVGIIAGADPAAEAAEIEAKMDSVAAHLQSSGGVR